MFLAQIVFSFRSACLKAVVTDFVLQGTRGEEERGDGGLLVRGGWMRGHAQGQDMRSRYIFISVKWAEYLLNSICIRMKKLKTVAGFSIFTETGSYKLPF